MPRADVTVAIATLGRPDALSRCVRAVLGGDTLPAELVIVDQSADEATARLVSGADWTRTTQVRYIRQPRLGLAASRNAAIAASSQRIVAFTDDDCVPDRRWLTAIVSAFDGSADVDVVTGRVLPLGTEQPGMWAASIRASRIRTKYRGRALPWAAGSGGNTAVRRHWLERVGGFDQRLGAGSGGRAAEDMDLLYRLLAAGATVQYEPDAIIFHERKDLTGWLATRSSYGYGMGAFCGMWLRRHDSYAGWMLARWFADRASSLARACARLRWHRVSGELLMMKKAVPGFVYGWRCNP